MKEYQEYFAQFLTKKLTEEDKAFADRFLTALKEVSKDIDVQRARLEREEHEALRNAEDCYFTY